jgi:phage N-6-adenine-methyltransferase
MTIAKALFASTKGDWATPLDLFDQLDAEFSFILDAAASKENKLCPDYLGPGSDLGEDALASRWVSPYQIDGYQLDGAVWCNPPYGRGIGLWVAKAIDEAMHGTTIVLLLPARTDTKWFHAAVAAGAEVRLIKGRLTFGGAPSAAPFPSALFIFRPHIEGPYEWVSM